MVKSLTKIKEQIAKLQKEADSIQASTIARIKKEISQHGLTAEHLFGASSGTATSKTSKAAKVSAKAGSAKPAKFADDKGNSWHGIGKRPGWVHDALAAGRSLAEFLVGADKSTSAAVEPAESPAKKVLKKATPAKKAFVSKAPGKKAGKAASVPAKKLAKAPAVAKKVPAKKAVKSKAPAKPVEA